MKTKLIILSILALCISAAPAMAATFGDGGTALQVVLDGITVTPVTGSSIDVTTDEIPDSEDSIWAISGSGGSISTIIIELASWADNNLFGIYDASNPAKMVQIFNGAAAAGSQAVISIKADGSVFLNIVTDTGIDFAGNAFGFYVDSTAGHPGWTGGIWRSDSSLNADQLDHMYAYQGNDSDVIQTPGNAPGTWSDNEYVLAFEDLHSMHWGDQNGINDGYPEWSDTEPDFTDFVVMVESVAPVPVPGAVLLGILGLSAAGMKLRRFA